MADAGVILSVPHGSCSLSKANYCDSLATDFAHLLSSDLRKLKIDPFQSVYNAKTYDHNVNQNDIKNRNSAFRRNLIQGTLDMENDYGNKLFHLDIHSYDPNTNYDWRDKDVIIVDDNLTTFNKNEMASTGLMYYLNDNKFVADLDKGIGNDIQDQMTENNIQSVIIELNENLSKSDLKELSKKVSDWIISEDEEYLTEGIHRYISKAAGLGLLGIVSSVCGMVLFNEIKNTMQEYDEFIKAKDEFIKGVP